MLWCYGVLGLTAWVGASDDGADKEKLVGKMYSGAD
jgi:hypothetical protein